MYWPNNTVNEILEVWSKKNNTYLLINKVIWGTTDLQITNNVALNLDEILIIMCA